MTRITASLCAFLLGAAAFFTAATVEPRVRAARPRLRQGIRTEREILPPAVQLLSALLGSFRSVLVDFFWIRAEALQQEGRYFAAAELARWITALQSRVESSWSFQAWNLGVNVPSMLRPEDRWPYVEAAINLLAKDGLAANPGSLGLHYEIGWFWLHRVGSDIDPAASIYRATVRDRVGAILGPQPWDIRAMVRDEELLPALREDPSVKAFLEAESAGLAPSSRDDPLLAAYDRARRAAAWRDAFGFALSTVEKVAERYGEVRLGSPESFVLCWTTRGLAMAEPGAVRLDILSLWRLRVSALLRLFRTGELALARAIDQDYADVAALVAADPVHRNQEELFVNDRRAFLREAIPLLYVSGWRRNAEAAFRRLVPLDSSVGPDTAWEDFAYRALVEDLVPGKATRQEVVTVLKALVRQSLGALERGDEESARSYQTFAADLRDAAERVFGGGGVPAFRALLDEVRAERNAGKRKGEG
jgi:hypothetical protein